MHLFFEMAKKMYYLMKYILLQKFAKLVIVSFSKPNITLTIFTENKRVFHKMQ